jgi:hypothetical protein
MQNTLQILEHLTVQVPVWTAEYNFQVINRSFVNL